MSEKFLALILPEFYFHYFNKSQNRLAPASTLENTQ
jgi:hypothetical protein